ncbi:MAG TPA: asparagine synthase (glutamine-hydrolyzing) [Ilumatobacteraceae bacterium]|nr:asparagine synthase (glutamine-hydrolyzing) [Ilumatobacteraceae bacterium]HRB04690.1 asparagine synthase (glutamine-hydrolyzing) [Ilumatobacteraceae bacterium]
MCGFAGLVRWSHQVAPPSRDLLTQMISAIRHRGPDGFGIYQDPYAGLVHARLALVDLTTGAQPLTNAGGEWWIVFNGEIFNHSELRRELEALGHHFRTTSDTEVIVNAFEAWGPTCFERFNGQWSMALWNLARRTLVLSRDPSGICPLFVRPTSGFIAFASEVKALLADPTAPRAFNAGGLAQTFTYWGAQAPSTPYVGVEEILPGTYSIFENGRRTDHVHWTPSYPPSCPTFAGTVADAAVELRERLAVAAELRVTSADVPVGAYLSGGLDSSVISLLLDDAKRESLSTYSISFDSAEHDETRFQRCVAAELGGQHHELRVTNQDIADAFPSAVWHAERPLLRTAATPMLLLSRAVRRSGVKAVLTGEGADEILAGYDLFREARIRRFWARQPSSDLRPALFDRIYPYLSHATPRARGMARAFWQVGLDQPDDPGFSHGPRWRSAGALQRFFSPTITEQLRTAPMPNVLDHLPAAFAAWGPLERAQYLEFTTLLNPYVLSTQGDRQLLANGVEGRFPFLDRTVMDFCNSLPSSFKLRSLDEKHVLKRAAADLVPPEVLARKKQPYRAPDAVCFVGDTAPDYVSNLLSAQAVERTGVFDPKMVGALHTKLTRQVRDSHGAGTVTNADNMALIGILSVQLLHHQLLEGGGAPSETGRIAFDVDVSNTSSTSGPTDAR